MAKSSGSTLTAIVRRSRPFEPWFCDHGPGASQGREALVGTDQPAAATLRPTEPLRNDSQRGVVAVLRGQRHGCNAGSKKPAAGLRQRRIQPWWRPVRTVFCGPSSPLEAVPRPSSSYKRNVRAALITTNLRTKIRTIPGPAVRSLWRSELFKLAKLHLSRVPPADEESAGELRTEEAGLLLGVERAPDLGGHSSGALLGTHLLSFNAWCRQELTAHDLRGMRTA